MIVNEKIIEEWNAVTQDICKLVCNMSTRIKYVIGAGGWSIIYIKCKLFIIN